MTDFHHRPVLGREVLAGLEPAGKELFLDGTVGGGGHAWMILDASRPAGRLIGLDQDETALEAAGVRLQEFAGRFALHRANFAAMRDFTRPGTCDGVLLDLGVSSPQLDRAERGFSFQQDGPLDMRMDRRQPGTAADLVNTWTAEALANCFWELGGERESRRVARAIEAERRARPFQTTMQLASVIERVLPRRGRTHPATKVFQALRMAVNRELEVLRAGLSAAWSCLKRQGRLAVITFHSLEDRMVKEFGRGLSRDYDFTGEVDIPALRVPRPAQARWISRKAIVPGDEELAENPRARSAQLRVLEKLEEAA